MLFFNHGKNGNVAPSDRINLAFIGPGNQAMNDIRDSDENFRRVCWIVRN